MEKEKKTNFILAYSFGDFILLLVGHVALWSVMRYQIMAAAWGETIHLITGLQERERESNRTVS